MASCPFISAQLAPSELARKGSQVKEMKVEDGDTLIISNLDPVSISSFRSFKSDEEYKKYQKYKYYDQKFTPMQLRLFGFSGKLNTSPRI